MLDAYLPILIMFVLAAGLVTVTAVAALLLGPKKPNAAKLSPYEGGVPLVQETSRRFPVKFLEVDTNQAKSWTLFVRPGKN